MLSSDESRTRCQRKAASLLGVVCILLFASSIAAVDVPALKGRVNDYAGLMPRDRADALAARLEQFERDTGHEIVVLTVPSLEGEEIASFGIKVGETWKIGKRGQDNGVILIVADKDRRLRTEVGYGLEGVLPDAVAKRIEDEQIIPRFKDGDFPGGIYAGVERIMEAVRGEVIQETANSNRSELPSGPMAFFGLLFLAAMVAFLIGLVQPSFLSAGLSGMVAGGLLGGAFWASGRLKGMTILLASGAVGVYANHYARMSWGRTWSAWGSSRREPWVGNTFVGSAYGDGGSGGGGYGSGGGGDSGGGGGGGGGGGFGGGGASGSW